MGGAGHPIKLAAVVAEETAKHPERPVEVLPLTNTGSG